MRRSPLPVDGAEAVSRAVGSGRRSRRPGLPFSRRGTWRNHTRNQTVDPLRIYRPRTLDELVEIVREAERRRCTVRAVGSGHSWSDVALTTGFLVRTDRLDRPLELETDLLRADAERERLVRTEAGIRLRELNAHLDRCGLALSNMGGYDAQTVAGVISTSTHGSGAGLGPLPDCIRSIDLVASGGAVYRIERHDGPTDRLRYERRHPGRLLVQDDHWFDAAVVGMGCMGLIHAVMLEVEPSYWLKEVRTLSTWSTVAAEIRDGGVLRDNRHFEVYLNPYGPTGDNLCLVTTRNRARRPAGHEPLHRRSRNSVPEFVATLPLTAKLLNLLLDFQPALSPRLLDRALRSLADEEFTSVSHEVLNIGTANLLPAYSCEIGVPVGAAEEAVARILDLAERYRKVGDIYHTSPIALRFVKASRAYLSMMHARDTMMIELIQMTRTEGGFELLAAYEEALYELGGRPHWGQVNTLSADAARIASMYPRYADWQDVHRRLNASRVFDGPFSKRVGISDRGYLPGR